VGSRIGLDNLEKRKFCTLSGFKLWLHGHPAHSQLIYWSSWNTEYGITDTMPIWREQ
jgi:hypothetical protein